MSTNVTFTMTGTGAVIKGVRLYKPGVQRPVQVRLSGGLATLPLNDGFYLILADFFGPVGSSANIKVSATTTALNSDGKITSGTHATIDRDFEVSNGEVYP